MTRRVLRAAWTAAAGIMALAAAGQLGARLVRDRFDHAEHRTLFPSCTSCHTGIAAADSPDEAGVWPPASVCASCHDGTVEDRVEWEPPPAPRTNLRFTHPMHAREVAGERADSAVRCQACHVEPGADRMEVRLAVAGNCVDCHRLGAPHLDVPDAACAECHVPLAEAARLAAEDIAGFPRPSSHERADFAEAGHARLARAGPGPIAASCATCHAQNFCAECHVNAPEVAAIRALAPDPRVVARGDSARVPKSHLEPDFIEEHGDLASDGARRCVTCHTQESCLVCHVGTPRVAQSLVAAGPGRPRGAATSRRRPASHGADFSATHAAPASASPGTCAACHARPQCLDCHVPDPAGGPPGYHRAGFLATHPVQAYQRTASCSDCHNPAQFCSTCHASAGLAAVDVPLDAGYHDAKRFFAAGHGQAARQSLESCVSCHTETDCMSCHATSTQGGRNLRPHGPGFDAERLRRRNPQMCTACHGAAIPQ
jgi:hypothetical protein